MRRRLHIAAGALAAVTTLAVTASIAGAHPTHDGSGKEAGFDLVAEEVSPGGVPLDARMTDIRCEDGMAEIFPCHKIDLASFVPLTELESIWTNDVWGWTDPVTGHEYALVSKFEGTAFVDVTDPYDPLYLGTLPTAVPGSFGNIWGDLKVYGDHAFIVTESGGHGMQVFDLTRLRGVTAPQDWTADNHITTFGHAHNIAVNEDTARVYVVGAVGGVTIPGCEDVHGGPIAFDVSDPANPQFDGCYGGDGYTHDIQCVIYDGPDAEHSGREICVASNEDTVTVLDITDMDNVEMLARTPYETSAYTHQGWFTEDQRYFLLGDELDEIFGTVDGTTTYIWDLTDLDDPVLNGTHNGGTTSIDHNIFIKDGLAYQSNYTAGLRINDTWKLGQGRMTERGFFDVYPSDDAVQFAGTWGNYPFFDSGNVVVTGIEEGLFVLKPRVKSSDDNNGQGDG